jgi:putative flippase GtrA
MNKLVTLVRELTRRPFGRYLIIGGLVYVFELIVIVAAIGLGASPVLAVGVSFWLGLIVSFILTKFITFSDRRTQHKVVLAQVVAVGLLVLFNFVFTLIVAHMLRDVVPAVISRTIALAITTLWNFQLYKTKIFKTPDPVIN